MSLNFPIESAVNEMPQDGRDMLSSTLEHMQVRDSLKMYNNLVERCFRECSEDMRSKALSSKEEQCVVKCCEKFMHVTGRVGMRFSEFFSQMEAAAQQHMAEMLKQQEQQSKS
ncbi:mitochondrial inner membrane translocase [Dunaliella salina]|uniref:Mitochondrial import inner membrane translocase subunit n=1 Tax=Dunaliella salina TaxID=3046 RepID=A0ABQ7H957_DUNSA|nr:mitochondrial inner membrane translocase [Dunaliella salina]|eukprot:KAF5843393.1 mitochondrial inner membrane translocase [Dunaliella salina]